MNGSCAVCGCTDQRACPGGCVWANATATLCSRCAQGADAPLVALPHELEARTHADNLRAALELGGFEGGVLPTVELEPGSVRSRAVLPDGRPVLLVWTAWGECVDCRLEQPTFAPDAFDGSGEHGETMDLIAIFGRDSAEAWLDERTEDEAIDREPPVPFQRLDLNTLERF